MSYTYSATLPAPVAHRDLLGTLKCAVEGQTTTWASGTRVKLICTVDGVCLVERILPEGARMFPIMDQMVGVPLEAIKLDAQLSSNQTA